MNEERKAADKRKSRINRKKDREDPNECPKLLFEVKK
jgi:hypothetical protein